MNYDSIKGCFGTFSGEADFLPGLNVIVGSNEKGKSTLCAFIRSMLYGFSSARDTKSSLSDKTKYTPWSGENLNGRLTLTKNGRTYILTRDSIKNGPMRDFSVITADTASTVEGMNGTNAGLIFCGVEQDVFDKAFLCSVDDLPVKNSALLETRIASAAGTGDEELSPKAVDATLVSWQNELLYGHRGKIPQCQSEIDQIKSQITETENINQKIIEASVEINELSEKREILSAEITNRETIKAAKRISKNIQLKKQYEELKEQTDFFIASNHLEGARADLDEVTRAEKSIRTASGLKTEIKLEESHIYQLEHSISKNEIPNELKMFDGCSSESAFEAARRDSETVTRCRSAHPKYFLILLTLIFTALSVTIFVLGEIPDYVRLFGLLTSVVSVCLAVFSIKSIISSSKMKRQAVAISEKWGCDDPDRYLGIASAYSAFIAGSDDKRSELEMARERITALSDRYKFVSISSDKAIRLLGLSETSAQREVSELLSKTNELTRMTEKLSVLAESIDPDLPDILPDIPAGESNYTEEQLRGAYSSVCSAIRTAELNIERYRGELTHISESGDVDYLYSLLKKKTTKLESLNKEYEAIGLARSVLSDCADELSQSLTPRIASRAEEIFSILTDGRYGELYLSREMEASAVPSGDIVAHKLLSLSKGASDQAWLAVRIAVSECLCPENEKIPLLLDDVFAMYDDKRALNGMKLLSNLSQTRQILLFTCRNRDKKLASELGANIITL